MTVDPTLPYGQGSHKIFGMENFGNTCYCNSILQCLYYTENFRAKLVSHNATKHERKLVQNGVKPHSFTTKYEQLVAKRMKEQGTKNGSSNGNANGSFSESSNLVAPDDRPKTSRKGSLFGIKFNSNSTPTHVIPNPSSEESKKMSAYIVKAGNCDALTLDQRNKINKDKHFQDLNILITRPTPLTITPAANRNDSSLSSSTLLNGDQPQQVNQEGSISSTSSAVIVGIPQPETFLVNPINPFNPNPSSDQRKRSALINGPIINLDSSIRLPSEQTDDSALLYALKDMFESMVENQSNTGVVSPTYFINKLKEKNFLFRQNNMHHDAHEFFNYLINEIIESVNKEIGIENNWCNEIFQGMITNETKCLSCETVTSKHEYFLDLSVDIPPGESAYSLSYSLNNFSKLEVLTNQNKFSCNTCSSLQEAVKTIKLKKLPEVLVINFKRFKYDEKVDKMVKLFDSISYPFKLRLFNTTDDETDFTLYELYALVIHIGGGPMHGHYVSICKIKSGLWLLFDDETVELVEDSYVMRFFGNGPGLASAYILFYSKCSTTSHHEEDEENTINFGYNVDNVYNGGDYTLFQQFDNDSSESTFKKTHKDIEEGNEINSETSSIASFTGPTVPNSKEFGSELTLKKSGLFKKNFKLDGAKEEKPLSRTGSIVEKKTWVGGLKRRESKAEPPVERKGSTSSSVGSNEKRKSIFGFKRKSQV